jgi:bisanhydrobacterioruberin hydratase
MMSENRTIALLIFLFLIGIIIQIPCIIRDYIIYVTTPFLFFVGSLAIYRLILNTSTKIKMALYIMLAIFSTLSIEIIAVRTGKIFGNYAYGDTLWLQLANVPVVIGLNWVVLILASNSISKWTAEYLYIKSDTLQIIIAGGYLVLLDYFMEPVAIKLNYWTWSGGYIPERNYIAWFIISILQLYILKVFQLDFKGKLLSAIYLIMLFYFLTLQIFLYPC